MSSPGHNDFETSFRDAVRNELTKFGAELTELVELPAGATITREELVARTLARIRQRDAGRVGRLGERIGRARARKRRIAAASGKARYRVPDILTDAELIEIKNVARLALTPQLSDFLTYADGEKITFVLLTRYDTVLTPELATLVAAGKIEHRHLGGLLSPAGRRLLRRLVDEAVQDTRPSD